jgi:lantibiotic modifying enzyme
VDQGNAPPHASPVETLPLLALGYREATSALMRCRESLLSPHSAWRWTLEHLHAPRIILRDTLTYSVLLSRSLQPHPLRTAQRRRTALRSALRDLGPRTFPKAILRTEASALFELQIPRLIGLPGSRTLANHSGRALVPRFLSCSPAEAVFRKLGELNPNRLGEIQIPGLLQAVLGRVGSG